MIVTNKGFLGACTESKNQHTYSMYQQEKFSKLAAKPYSALQHIKKIFPDICSFQNSQELMSSLKSYKQISNRV